MNASRPDVGSSAKSSGGFVKTLEEKKMKVKPVYDGHSDVQLLKA